MRPSWQCWHWCLVLVLLSSCTGEGTPPAHLQELLCANLVKESAVDAVNITAQKIMEAAAQPLSSEDHVRKHCGTRQAEGGNHPHLTVPAAQPFSSLSALCIGLPQVACMHACCMKTPLMHSQQHQQVPATPPPQQQQPCRMMPRWTWALPSPTCSKPSSKT